jgi:predicted RecA/RadA family phage recombinase
MSLVFSNQQMTTPYLDAAKVVTEVLAQENINQFDMVTADGYIANSSVLSKKNKLVGMAMADIPTGFKGGVVSEGIIINELWAWAIGDKLFLNGTSISTTSPGAGNFSQMIGKAVASDTIEIKIDQAVLL